MTYIKQSIVSIRVYPLCQRRNEGIDSKPIVIVHGIQY